MTRAFIGFLRSEGLEDTVPRDRDWMVLMSVCGRLIHHCAIILREHLSSGLIGLFCFDRNLKGV